MKAKKFVNSKLGDKNYTHSEFPISRETLEEWLTEFAESEVKNLHLQNVTNSTPKKGTEWYIIVVTLLVAASAGLIGFGVKSIDAAIITALLCLVALCASTRFQV